MIFDLFLTAVMYIRTSFLGLLPQSQGFPPEVFSAVSALSGYIDIFSPIIPWATLSTCVALVFGAEIALFAFKTMKWLLSYLPFIGGKG